jgi:hypothetical protein
MPFCKRVLKAEIPGLIVTTKPVRKRPFVKAPAPAIGMLLGYAADSDPRRPPIPI